MLWGIVHKYLTVIDIGNHCWRRKNNFVVNCSLSPPLPSPLHFTSQRTKRCLLDGLVLAGKSFFIGFAGSLLLALLPCRRGTCPLEMFCYWQKKIGSLAQMVKNLPAIQETWVRPLRQEDLLEKGMGTHSSILTWKIPWTEEPGRLQSMESKRVGHDWATNTLSHF